MTDSNTDSNKQSEGAATPGGLLKKERERQGITPQRIAADMHLSTLVIDAIEANRFGTLGAPVFAKGHLRKYAHLLGVPVERVVELYERLDNVPRQEDPVPLTQRAPDPTLRPTIRDVVGGGEHRSFALWAWAGGGVVLTAAIAGGIWWFLQMRAPVAATAERQMAPEVAKTRADAKVVAAPPSAPPAKTVPSEPPAIAAPARTVRAAGAPPPGKVRLRLTFARDSWVEVYDVNGNRMLYDVGRVDFPRMVDVEPPALVVLGDARAVATEANGQSLTIPRKNISGTVARFTIAADGSVQ